MGAGPCGHIVLELAVSNNPGGLVDDLAGGQGAKGTKDLPEKALVHHGGDALDIEDPVLGPREIASAHPLLGESGAAVRGVRR